MGTCADILGPTSAYLSRRWPLNPGSGSDLCKLLGGFPAQALINALVGSDSAQRLRCGPPVDFGQLARSFQAQAVIDAPVAGDGPQCLRCGPPVQFGQLPGCFQAQSVIGARVASNRQEGADASSRIEPG